MLRVVSHFFRHLEKRDKYTSAWKTPPARRGDTRCTEAFREELFENWDKRKSRLVSMTSRVPYIGLLAINPASKNVYCTKFGYFLVARRFIYSGSICFLNLPIFDNFNFTWKQKQNKLIQLHELSQYAGLMNSHPATRHQTNFQLGQENLREYRHSYGTVQHFCSVNTELEPPFV